MITDCLLM